MTHSFTEKKRFRRSFSKVRYKPTPQSLLRLQHESYKDFLQREVPPEKRRNIGLQNAFNTVFPIVSTSGLVSLNFLSYRLVGPHYDVQECKDRGITYFVSVYADIQMAIREKKGGDVKKVKQEEVYMGDVPMMTGHGSFVINGTDRVVVSQLHRSPGVLFEHDSGRGTLSKKYLYSARIIPYFGRWLDFEFDQRDLVYFRIDRRRKMPVTVLLKAIGYSEEEILRHFYDFDRFTLGGKPNEVIYHLNQDFLQNASLPFDLKGPDGAVIVPKNQRIKKADIPKIAKLDREYPVDDSFLMEKRLATHIIDEEGEVVVRANTAIDAEALARIRAAGIRNLHTLHFNELNRGPYISNTLVLDEKLDEDLARNAIYRMLRPGDPPNAEVVNTYLDGIFFNQVNYNLSKVGRMKLNRRLDRARDPMEYRIWVDRDRLAGEKGAQAAAVDNLLEQGCFDSRARAVKFIDFVVRYGNRCSAAENLTQKEAEALSKKLDRVPHEILEQRTLSCDDIMQVVKMLVDLRNGKGRTDDIDSMTNRRVRTVGEFVSNYFQQGLLRVDRAIRDRLSRAETEGLMPHDIISAKAISASVSEFFNGDQLSQFMDHTNPLSGITHKRRVSAFGLGGLTRDRVGFEVRDVHPTHYGRVCPIETPEGQNIGLINSMSVYSSVDHYGFLQTCYLVVNNGRVTDQAVYLSAIEEEGKVIAQANTRQDGKGRITDEAVAARMDGEYVTVSPDEVDYIDISPAQIASVSASMIPFLEHDDANRALMGSNMQRQAVPCLQAEKPLVGTGMERLVAGDSGAVIKAERPGTVAYVDADRIVVNVDSKAVGEDTPLGVDIYHPTKHIRSNQNTGINQCPIVRVGDKVKAGDVIADGASIDFGELSLGQNLLVAFLPWNGYNFEDSILISERVVSEQRYASVHIIEEVAHARSTGHLGDEEITRDIPHQPDSALQNLDEEGIVRVGVEVHPGDILVGKVTPKGERQMSPEERLLQAVFGDKANDFKDTSLRMPPGGSGVVIDVKVFASEEVRKKEKRKPATGKRERATVINEEELRRYKENQEIDFEFARQDAADRIARLVKKGKSGAEPKRADILLLFDGGAKESKSELKARIKRLSTDKGSVSAIQAVVESVKDEEGHKRERIKTMEKKIIGGHELQQGILKTVKVYVAVKRNLQVGDKMAGRHGNKGVVSRIEPVENMPYLANGTPVDIVLNPLGVPSRMNVGQILETHLGFAAKGLGNKINDMFRHERDKQIKEIRAFLKKVYAGDTTCDIGDLSDKELLAMAKNLSSGVPFATPIFDGASENEIRDMLTLAGLPESGQVTLYDGHSGEPFSRPVTVGYMYIMKLHHLVDDKMHSRATGPYSLVTQQPLGGKAQRGGQRLGEMEVWALEAYGASYTLCELLTVKSDDISWRTKMFENIIDNDFQLKSGVPESFNVLMREIRAMGIDMDVN